MAVAVSTLVGTTLAGRYRLDAKVGTGGMSTVWRAFDTVLERPVALKLMHREIAAADEQLERFRREARAVAQLNHPHIVQVIDYGSDEDVPFIVFEYVHGETLKDRIRRLGRLAVPEAIAYAIEIARALGAAHERGIVHRDVKPQNVLVDEEGSAKVTDFGIARTLDQEGLTADGRVLGTTDYVSPEQALGHTVTGQSDLYSLGVVLFEMLTGDVPFRGENQVAVAMRHVREELPDVQQRRPEVSSALAAVLDRATAKDLGRRHPTARALIADLEDVLAIETARAGQATGEATAVLRTLPEPTRARLPLRLRTSTRVVAVVLALAAVAVAGVLYFAAEGTERGTTPVASAPADSADARTQFVRLAQDAATDFDPEGGDGEGTDETRYAVDGDPGTVWTTENYRGGTLNDKAGVGIYVDAGTDDGGGVPGRELVVRTDTPGFTAAVYGAEQGPPDELAGWARLAPAQRIGADETIALDPGGAEPRYYLLWITALPEGTGEIEISELGLARAVGR
jgi:serine/threonine-protein kinase